MFGVPTGVPGYSVGNPSVGVPPGTATFTLPTGEVVSFVNWLDDKLYGTVELQTSDSTSLDCFSTGKSGQIPGGTRSQSRVDTNIPRAGDNGLPMAWEGLVYAIGVDAIRAMRIGSGSAPTLGDVSSYTYSNAVTFDTFWQVDRLMELEFLYNGKTYATGVPSDFPAGRGVFFQGTANNIHVAHNGVPSPRDRASMVLPVHMLPNEGYKMTFQPEASLTISQAAADGSTALTYMDWKVTLYGLFKEPVK